MDFQPIGYPFEVRSSLAAPALKQSILARLRTPYDLQDGPRGWMVGPAMCLWFKALDSQGPMVLAWLSRRDGVTRITGRAGSDLNGTLLLLVFALASPFMILSIAHLESPGFVLAAAGVVAALMGLILWKRHRLRNEAHPLVEFLAKIAAEADHTDEEPNEGWATPIPLRLVLNGDTLIDGVATDVLRDVLSGMARDDFAILSVDDETYLQTAVTQDGFVIERRDGGASRHFRAERAASEPASMSDPDPEFTLEETLHVFTAYAAAEPSPAFIEWRSMS